MTSKPEKETERGPERGGGSEKRQTAKKVESPTSFLEDLMTLFKIRFLKRRNGLDRVGTDKLEQLEEQIKDGDDKEKLKASREISKLFQMSDQADQVSNREVTLEEVMTEVGETDATIVGTARLIDKRLEQFKGLGNKANKKDAEGVIRELEGLATLTKVKLEKGKSSEVQEAINAEIGRLRGMKDEAKLLQQREGLREMAADEKRVMADELKEEILETEDLKSNSARRLGKRTFYVRKGLKRKEMQEKVDIFLDEVRTDFRAEGMGDISEEALMRKFLDSKNITRNRYGGRDEQEAAYDLGMAISFVYGEELANKIAERVGKQIKGGDSEAARRLLKFQALEGLQEVWANSTRNTKIGEALKVIREQFAFFQGHAGLGEEIADQQVAKARRVLEGMETYGMGGGGRGRGELGEWQDLFEEKEIGPEDIFALMNDVQRTHVDDLGARQAAFVESLHNRYRIEADKALKMYESFQNVKGKEHFETLRKHLGKEDYKAYTKEIFSYLARVGLKEGSRDIYLQSLMTEARSILSRVEGAPYLELFDAFEKIMIFQDAFGSLSGMEDYARLAKLVGVESFQAFMEEYATALNAEVKVGEREVSVGAWDFRDMLEEQGWAKRMHYRELLKTDDLYGEMVVSKLMGETCWVRDGEIFNADGQRLGSLDDEIRVKREGRDDLTMSIGTFMSENKWMVNVAHGYWRASGRWANVLDDLKISKSVENKNLAAVYKIKRYCEEYGIVDTSLLEALGVDGLIYSFENYKGLVGKGIAKLLGEAGVDSGLAGKLGGLIENHVKNVRKIRDETFLTNYMSVDDVRLLAYETLTREQATLEFERRQREQGNVIDWGNLSNKQRALYEKQIGYIQKRHEKQKFTARERQLLSQADWGAVNVELGRRLGVEIEGNTFEAFMDNFSFTRMTTYVHLRATDMENFGGYCVRAEGVIGVFKSGFKKGATQAMVEALGAMLGYVPPTSSGERRYAAKMMEVVYDLRTKKLGKFSQPGYKKLPEPDSDWGPLEYMRGEQSDWTLDGEVMGNGEYVVDEYGNWVPASTEETMLWNESITEHNNFLKSLGMQDVEYAMRFAVNNGVMTRGDMEKFLSKRYGPKAWRWLRRNLLPNDWWYVWDAAIEEGNKGIKGALEYIFSG